MNLIILFEKDFVHKDHILLKDARVQHIHTILKASPGKKLRVGLMNGKIGTGEVIHSSKEKIEMVVQLNEPSPPSLPIHLILALPRPQTLKKVLETISTFGIQKLTLINAARVEQSFFESTLLKNDNYLKHVYLGLEQGMRTEPPLIEIQKSWDCLKNINASFQFIADPSAQKTFCDFPISKFRKDVAIAIGPEGGWIDSEIKKLNLSGFEVVSLGKTLHRVENAVTAALSQIEMLMKN